MLSLRPLARPRVWLVMMLMLLCVAVYVRWLWPAPLFVAVFVYTLRTLRAVPNQKGLPIAVRPVRIALTAIALVVTGWISAVSLAMWLVILIANL